MTTWTMRQVYDAQRLRANLVVDQEVIDRGGRTVIADAEDKMAERLVHMAHPLAIELHRDDLEVVWDREESTREWQVTGRMRWAPSTHEAELHGGHLDGQRFAIRDVGSPLRVPRPAVSPWLDVDATSEVAALTEIADTYELAGWREDERVWVYAVH